MKSALFNVDKAYTHKVRQTKPFCFYQQTLFNKSTKTLGMNSLVFPLLCLLIYKYIVFVCSRYICDALRHLVPFVKFKQHEKHPWRSDTFSKVADLSLQLYWPQQPVTLQKVSLLHGCFSHFLNCTYGSISCKAPHLIQKLPGSYIKPWQEGVQV